MDYHLSVVREKGPHEDHEEQSGGDARQQAERAYQPKGRDERPHEGARRSANSRRRYWRVRYVPRHSIGLGLPRAKQDEIPPGVLEEWDPVQFAFAIFRRTRVNSTYLASVGTPGHGHDHEEWRRAKVVIQANVKAHRFPEERTVVRLDGLDGSGAVRAAVADVASVTRGTDDGLLDHATIQARLHVPADQHVRSAESGICRALSDCPDQRLSESGPLVRVMVATHPAPAKKKKKRQVGLFRDGSVYELFWTNLPQSTFTASDVVSLSLHRGAFETALEDEDLEQEPDRWWSHSAWGQEAWQVISQWTWNLRLELGHKLLPEPVRTTECAPALPEQNEPTSTPPVFPAPTAPASGYAPPATATSKDQQAASQELTFPSNRMERCVVLRATPWSRMNTGENAMGVCGLSPPPVFGIVVRARNVSSANGVAAPRPNLAR